MSKLSSQKSNWLIYAENVGKKEEQAFLSNFGEVKGNNLNKPKTFEEITWFKYCGRVKLEKENPELHKQWGKVRSTSGGADPSKKLEKNIFVVPNTVHKSYYNKAKIQQKIIEKYKNNFVFLYVGDTGIRRGLQTAIEAISVLKDKIPTVKLVIVGSNSSDIFLKQQVEDLNIQKYVDFEGWQNENLFPSYIMASSICISPLHRNLHHDTTYANKIFQYMSFAKPLLVSDATSQKNIVEKAQAGLVHKAENVEDFIEKALELYHVQVARIKFGENGKAFIENDFYWEKTSGKLIELYANLNQWKKH